MARQAEKAVDLALIGYAQAGKTTLAVGLYATSTPEFTVIGEDERTESYLRSRKAMLESGCWLDATKENDRPDLVLSLRRPGRGPVSVRFKEYMGEIAGDSESYKRDVIGRPRGAVILLNPKMEILSDVMRRVEMLAQLKDIIDYLSAPETGCEFVALVTTAADLLESADPAFVERFEAYRAEIANCLRTSRYVEGRTWKAFSVSVCGHLTDPSAPKLAHGEANTSRLPFEWLIDCVRSGNRRRMLKSLRNRLISLAILAGVAGLGALGAWYWGFDRTNERDLEALIPEFDARLEATRRQVQETRDPQALDDLCREIEKAIRESQDAGADFDNNRERLEKVYRLCRERIDIALGDYFPLFIDQLAVDAAQTADEKSCIAWRERIEGWSPVSDDARAVKAKALENFTSRLPALRTAYECRLYADKAQALADRLVAFRAGDDGSVETLHQLLRDCRTFERSAEDELGLLYVPHEMRQKTWLDLRAKREAVLSALIDRRIARLDVRAQQEPRVTRDEPLLLVIASRDALSEADAQTWFKTLDPAVERRREAWADYHNGFCREFLQKWSGADSVDAVLSALTAFQELSAEHAAAPTYDAAVTAVHQLIGRTFESLVEDLHRDDHEQNLSRDQLEENFVQLCALCVRVIAVAETAPKLRRSCWHEFAQKCCDRGIRQGLARAFVQRYVVKRIDFAFDVRSLYGQKRPFVIRPSFGETVPESFRKASSADERELMLTTGMTTESQSVWSGMLEATGNPWRRQHLAVWASVDGREQCFTFTPRSGAACPESVELPAKTFEVSNLTGRNTSLTATPMVRLSSVGENIWDLLPKDTSLLLK